MALAVSDGQAHATQCAVSPCPLLLVQDIPLSKAWDLMFKNVSPLPYEQGNL